jgi:hypothetical protein
VSSRKGSSVVTAEADTAADTVEEKCPLSAVKLNCGSVKAEVVLKPGSGCVSVFFRDKPLLVNGKQLLSKASQILTREYTRVCCLP